MRNRFEWYYLQGGDNFLFLPAYCEVEKDRARLMRAPWVALATAIIECREFLHKIAAQNYLLQTAVDLEVC